MSVPLRLVVREAVASARAERVGSILTALLVAGLCLSVLMTTGRTVGAERQVLATIDAAGTRTVVVRAEPDAGVDSTVIERLSAVAGIEWAGAFGPAEDLRNATIDGGPAVASRRFWSEDASVVTGDRHFAVDNSALVTPTAAQQLGMIDAVGEAVTPDGLTIPVVGEVELPDFLSFMDPIALMPDDARGPVAIVVVVVSRASDVEALTPMIRTALMARDPAQVSVATSDDLARVQEVVAGQLSGYGRSLVTAILVAVGTMVAALMYGLVMIRRKDFGRRRALGASQSLIVMLVLVRTAVCAVPGAVIGVLGGAAVIAALGDPQPGPSFSAGLAILAVGTAVLAAVVPAVVASRREPLAELRVP